MNLRIVLFSFLLLALCPAMPNGVNARDKNTCYDTHDYNRRHCMPSYFIGNDEVFFKGQVVKGASAMNFKILRDGYGKDAWSVYYMGKKLDGASPDSFALLDDCYAKDTWTVFFDGEKIKGASPDTFKVLGHGYAKDAWNVYFDGVKIDGASSDSFKVMHDGYAKDTWSTYYFGIQKSYNVTGGHGYALVHGIVYTLVRFADPSQPPVISGLDV